MGAMHTSKKSGRSKLIGNLCEFVHGDSFEEYLDRADNFFEMNSITNMKFKKSILIHFIGNKTYSQLVKLLAPKTVTETNYEIIVNTLKEYFTNDMCDLVVHYRFNIRGQQAAESIQNYAKEVQLLSNSCNFGHFRDTALRDRFIVGLRCAELQEFLLHKATKLTKENKRFQLSFEDVVLMARKVEMTKSDIQKLQEQNNVQHFKGLPKINKILNNQDKTGNDIQKKDFIPLNVRNEVRHDNNHTAKNSDPTERNYVPPTPTENEDVLFASGATSGVNFIKFDEIPVNVSGEDIPPAIDAFHNSGLSDFVVQNIKRSGYLQPTPIQKNAIPIILAGRDIMGCAQNGSGKTAAFLLPIISKLLTDEKPMSGNKPHVLVVSPTRELAIQIEAECRKYDWKSFLKTLLVYGGTASGYQMDKATNGCHLLIATPGRLLDFVSRDVVSFEDLRYLVLDEADRMLDMGFLPDIEKLMQHASMPPPDKRQTLMFSATFPEKIQRLAGKFLNKYLFVAVGIVGGASTDVEQCVYEVPRFEKRKKLMEIIEKEEPDGIIVFVETKRNADFLATFLSEKQVSSTSMHGDRYQRQREEALNDFKSGKMKLLIATSVGARGLDIKNVRHVINFDLPKSIDEYVHRIGGTRIGNCGKSTSFFDAEEDYTIAADLKKILHQAGQKVPEFLMDIDVSSSRQHGNSRNGNFGRDVRKGQYHRKPERGE